MGKGGHGVEVYNVEDGEYANVPVTFNGEQVDKWEDLMDLCLTPQQKDMYENGPDELKEQIDNYLKDLHGQLVKDEVDRLNGDEETEAKPQYQKFENVDDLVQNMDAIITDDFVNNLKAIGSSWYYYETYRNMRSIAVALHKSRYSAQHATYVPEKKFKKDIADCVPERDFNFTWNGSSASHNRLRAAVDKGEKIRLYRGINSYALGNKGAYKTKEEYFTDPKDVKSTLLGDKNGMFGTCIYVSSNKDYVEDSYDSGLILNGYIDTSKAKVYVIDSSDDTSGLESELHENLMRRKYDILTSFESSLLKKGVDQNTIANFKRQLEDGIDEDFGFNCMLMGYDAFVAHGHQVDILNPKVWKVEE